MKEFDELMSYCHKNYDLGSCLICGNAGSHCHCLQQGKFQGDCQECIRHILWNDDPMFHYPCERITNLYVLRFFNRFASEIRHAFHPEIKAESFNVVSLGCGPASELFGIVDAIRENSPNVKRIVYRGYDLNPIWEHIHQKTLDLFSQSNIDVKFYNDDMFNAWHSEDGGDVDFLMLNYMLSDCIKQMKDKSDLVNLLNSMIDFIITHKVKFVICNDISIYGYPKDYLDTSIQCIKHVIKGLSNQKQNVSEVSALGFCFPSDKYIPPKTNWRVFKDESLSFPMDPVYDQYTDNLNRCASKMMIIQIKHDS